MKILCIGDIVGKPGRRAVVGLLSELRKEFNIDFVVANAENSAGGAGCTSRMARYLIAGGCDVLTMGDHVWDQKEFESFLNESDRVVRPANFPEGVPGKGYTIQTTKDGKKVAVINLLGRIFMRYNVTCPFLGLQKMVEEIQKITPIIIVDMHAEATSEKVAIGHFADGKVSIVFGTHTHIPTADETVLPHKTAYITDLGMTGPYDSVIGQNKEAIIERFLKSMPVRFHVAKDDVKLSSILVDVDDATGRARSIMRVQRPFQDVADDSAEDGS
jgi:metallophosphoesterase (TIGR00282 family)